MLFQRAFAKINLGLKILRKREDGYHDIETVLHRVDISDDLTVEKADGLSLVCSDPDLGGEDNLVLRAARALRDRCGVRDGALLTLGKRIPHGAGLGGGSADAAAALLLLSRHWGLDLPPGDLAEVAVSLGSDVPFFLGAGTAHATSRGERITRFDLTLPSAILVVSPPLRISTREAYRSVVPRGEGGEGDLRVLLERLSGRPDLFRGVIANDFEDSVFRAYPGVASIRDRLYREGAEFALMSGSGSSVFGLFPDAPSARRAAAGFTGGARTFVTAPGFRPDLGIRGAPPAAGGPPVD